MLPIIGIRTASKNVSVCNVTNLCSCVCCLATQKVICKTAFLNTAFVTLMHNRLQHWLWTQNACSHKQMLAVVPVGTLCMRAVCMGMGTFGLNGALGHQIRI